MRNRVGRGVAGVAAGLLLTGAAVMPASAEELPDCSTEFGALSGATSASEFTNDRDQVALLGKVDNAQVKYGLGKIADSVQKLTDYQVKVERLLATGKLLVQQDPEGMSVVLNDLAEEVIGCVTAATP
jgi:hypothetical protein